MIVYEKVSGRLPPALPTQRVIVWKGGLLLSQVVCWSVHCSRLAGPKDLSFLTTVTQLEEDGHHWVGLTQRLC